MNRSSSPAEPRPARERVFVQLAARANQRLLVDLLAQRYDVVEGEIDAGVDLCVVDGLTLHRRWSALAALRSAQEPILLPILLISDRRDVGLVTRDAWRVIDDVLLRPVERVELSARVETMMRGRRLSLQLHEMSQRYEHERRIARTLQEAALPNALPRTPGLAFDAYYRPASDASRVGGDWYDALRLIDGRIVVSIGDVCGSGIDAAVTMTNLRQVLRGVAHVHPDPAIMLDAADRTLQAEGNDRIATAFVAVLDPVTSLLTYGSAGHPRPFLRAADGTLTELAAEGLPLGVPGRLPRMTLTTPMPPDAMLVLYTDGLIEATRDVELGEARLRDASRADATADSPHPARTLYDSVLSEPSPDDVAVFTLRRAGGEGRAIRRWSFASGDADAARTVRREFSDALRDHGLSVDAIGSAELLFAELVGNVVRYAGGTTEVALDRNGPLPVLHVFDRGPGFRHLPKLPADVLSESGRGLYIVAALAEDFSVTRRPDGGSHARVVLGPGAGRGAAPAPGATFAGLDTIEAT